jgi:hypothetical protein
MSKTKISFNYETPQGLKSFELSAARLGKSGAHDLSEEEREGSLTSTFGDGDSD